MPTEPMNILWVKSGPLFPLDSGGKKRTHATLEEISRRHHVTYLALLAEGQVLHEDETSAPYAAEKVWLPWRETAKGTWRFYRDLLRNFVLSSYPYALEKYCSQGMMDWLKAEISKERFDLIICDFLTPAPNFIHLESKAPMILFQHNMEAVIWKRLAESSPRLIGRFYLRDQFRRFSKWEEKLSRLFDGVITVSEDDSVYARKNYHLDNVRGHVATGVDVDHFAPRKEIGSASDVIGFLGSMDWMANIQAVEFFVAEAYPVIKRAIPGVRFMVIGRNPPESIRKLALNDESIMVTGSVDDVRPYLKMCDLMVVPLLAGGGTRIKILEAMAMGVPVVSTTIGAEGLDLESGVHLEIADGAGPLAACTAELLLDDRRRQALADAAHARVVRENGWKSVVDEFLRLCGGE
ncbi:glycosyltransferase [Luteolibacter sp. SL250]|uniref:glycosyltransferase n=1 Tax=Luteolibacter sp. SL250 TaxID=2995170 RepID=UPI00226E1167|nr:glycosyltransferase [Luteolibacter sp. SL250]WAC19630.1 glycosyltransferase [Luteolibacter sp. SL250]